jgi:hypothetical protein
MEQAFALDETDARVLFELDLLKKRTRVAPQKRFAFLAKYRGLVDEREDLLVEFVTMLNFVGQHEQALEILLSRKFHPWEGGEGKVTGQYVVSLVEIAKERLDAANDSALAREAIDVAAVDVERDRVDQAVDRGHLVLRSGRDAVERVARQLVQSAAIDEPPEASPQGPQPPFFPRVPGRVPCQPGWSTPKPGSDSTKFPSAVTVIGPTTSHWPVS